jgi:hypothetical protein
LIIKNKQEHAELEFGVPSRKAGAVEPPRELSPKDKLAKLPAAAQKH